MHISISFPPPHFLAISTNPIGGLQFGVFPYTPTSFTPLSKVPSNTSDLLHKRNRRSAQIRVSRYPSSQASTTSTLFHFNSNIYQSCFNFDSQSTIIVFKKKDHETLKKQASMAGALAIIGVARCVWCLVMYQSAPCAIAGMNIWDIVQMWTQRSDGAYWMSYPAQFQRRYQVFPCLSFPTFTLLLFLPQFSVTPT